MRIERVLAPNPGPYTGQGTNTYVVEDGGFAAIIDPGPVIGTHLAAIEHALGEAAAVAVLVTHTHPDHAPAANPLGARLGVPVLGFAPGPEFEPTATLADGDTVEIAGSRLEVVHTPGHTADHVCYLMDGVLFTGDHIMGGSTVVIEDASRYMASLQRVLALGPDHLCPGHGPELTDAVQVVEAYIAHRREREDQIVAAVARGATGVDEIVDAVYADLDDTLVPAAEHQVRVQLKKLAEDGRLEWSPGGTGTGAAIRLPGDRPSRD